MKTTNLFIELLVIGVGAVLCLGLLIHNLADLSSFKELSINSAVLLFPITAVTYVFGIIFDRIFDILTDPWDKYIRHQHLTDEQYKDVRTILYNDSRMVQDVFDYTKNRVRIVRSWMFYFPLLAAQIPFTNDVIFLSEKSTLIIILLVLFLLSMITFWKLTHSFYGILEAANGAVEK